MVEMFQTKIWDDMIDKMIQALTVVGGVAFDYVIRPYDFQTKIGPFIYDAVNNLWQSPVLGNEILPRVNIECYYGAIILAENDRVFALENDNGGDLVEVDVDDPSLMNAHIIMFDDAGKIIVGDCPNILKNKKVWKELQCPILLKPYDATNNPIRYFLKSIIYEPKDPHGNLQPPVDYDFEEVNGSDGVAPYILVVMPALLIMKTSCTNTPPATVTLCPTSPAAFGV